MKMPTDIGPIHFVGIGGIGMSGIAEVMTNLGYRVQGSDMSENANVKRLSGMGVTISIGHAAENVGDARVVVVSSAIKPDNPELVEARGRFVPVVQRAEMLAELMRLKSAVAIGGTHGKTTTTSMVATLFDAASLDPTVINGGIINAYGTNARLGGGDWMIVEADESDGSFVKLPAEIAIVTNIDPEHLDHYGSFDKLRAAFASFIENIPFYGFAVMCIDHPEVQALVGRIKDRRILTYGTNPQADLQLVNLRYERNANWFDVRIRNRRTGIERIIDDLSLPMPGLHNALNAVAAIAVVDRLGVAPETIREGLAGFTGVKRRFTLTGAWNGVSIYDDYGHHPVEIAAVLKAARQATESRILAVMQPHRYTRLRDLFEDFCTCFNDADGVFIAPVYEAGEAPIEGVDSDALVAGLQAHGHRFARSISGSDDLPDAVASFVKPGDMVICLGAGSITQWAYVLPKALEDRAG